ncbi:hypothetical protein [Clostridium omnivorum]|uniref:Uncharacterized protein n=1 Tax=Clostridium omnivorum TaxID=1604902 RepID=A0ABQ5N4C9_9CLOT|nr:hypothetical protein [Clostridium sp. E14]GLC29979.1 hypothetical protein bsdE14_13890 [Clostridium sp. E14]
MFIALLFFILIATSAFGYFYFMGKLNTQRKQIVVLSKQNQELIKKLSIMKAHEREYENNTSSFNNSDVS